MRFVINFISVDRIKKLSSVNKKEALEEMVELIGISELITDKKEFLEKIIERENILSTGIGLGIAVPHVKLPSVKDFVIAIGVSKKGIQFDAIDARPVHIIVMIGASGRQGGEYIKVLAKIVLLLKNKEVRHKIVYANSSTEIYEIFEKCSEKYLL